MEVAVAAVSPKAASLRFWYGASIADFLESNAEKIVGQLTLNSSFDIDRTQAAAWLVQIDFLQAQVNGFTGSIFFEFNIPRMGRRIDVVLVIGPVIFAIEFKVGEKTFDRSAIDQVWDYGLDLEFSRGESRRFDHSNFNRDRSNGVSSDRPSRRRRQTLSPARRRFSELPECHQRSTCEGEWRSPGCRSVGACFKQKQLNDRSRVCFPRSNVF